MYYRKLIGLVFALVMNHLVHAQSKDSTARFTDNLQLNVNVHAGYNLPEDPLFTLLTEDYIRSIDISLIKGTDGSNLWEQVYAYPEHGLSLFYSTLGNDDVLGRELALNYLLRISIVSSNRFRFYNQLGIGLNYVNKKFDFESNYLNVATGSNVNLHFNCRFGGSFQMSRALGLNMGVSFDHFSNANTNEPNLGVNYLTGFTGLSYKLGQDVRNPEIIKQEVNRQNMVRAFVSVGGKHLESLSSRYYFTFASSLELKRKVFHAFNVGAGLDFFYDSSVEDQSERNNLEYKKIHDFQTGVHIAQSFVFNRFSLTLQEGIYVFLPERILARKLYSRGVMQYRILDDFFVRIAMKSHLHILDYPEIGVGYQF